MVLWAYGMMLRDSARKTGVNTPIRNSPLASGGGGGGALAPNISRKNIFLDAPPCHDSNLFTASNVGRPCLRSGSGSDEKICHLRNPAEMMMLGSRLLERNCPTEPRERMPQMLRSLCGLMDDLGALD